MDLPYRVPSSDRPAPDGTQTPDMVLGDYYDAYIPHELENFLSRKHLESPPTPLRKIVGPNGLSDGQWVLWFTSLFTGQVFNGGLEQFFDNYPFLVMDAEHHLERFGPPDLLNAYQASARPFLDTISSLLRDGTMPHPDELTVILTDAWDHVSEDAIQMVNTHFMVHTDPDTGQFGMANDSWAFRHIRAVINFVEGNPSEFVDD